MSQTTSSPAQRQLRETRRLVVKIGSALLCDDAGVRASWLDACASDLAAVRDRGAEIVVVSSGAVALGARRLNLARQLRLDEKQAASAAGQAALMQAWQTALAPHDICAAQILLTLDDTEHRKRYLNARATFRTLLDIGALPVVNENDTVATSEIRYGDNDRLAAHVAQLIEADALLILSDVDGVYNADPRKHAAAERFKEIDIVTAEIEAAAAGPNRDAGVGSGGMASKLAAAKLAAQNGCATIIADGRRRHPLTAILEGDAATLIRAGVSPETARRQWIGGRLKPAGEIHIDQGAERALRDGASLLPAGVVKVAGDFARGDAVCVVGPAGQIIGQGLSAYRAAEVRQIAGRRSDDIDAVLGYKRRPAVIEKNDLVLRSGRQP